MAARSKASRGLPCVLCAVLAAACGADPEGPGSIAGAIGLDAADGHADTGADAAPRAPDGHAADPDAGAPDAAFDAPIAPGDAAAETTAVEPADVAEEDLAEEDVEEEDTGPLLPPPETPVDGVLGPPIAATAELLVKGKVGHVAALTGAVVLAEAGTQTVVVTGTAVPPEVVAGDTGPLRGVVLMGGTAPLVAADKGLFALVGAKFVASPAGKLLPAPPRALARMAGPAGAEWLWLATAKSLHLHDGKALHAVALQGVDLAAAKVAAGPSLQAPTAAPALWLAAGKSVHAVVVAGTEATAWLQKSDLEATDVAAAGDGSLWLAVGGDLRRRGADGTWQWLHLPSPVSGVAARSDRAEAVVTAKSGLWLYKDGVFFALLATQGLQARGLDAAGRVLASGPAGLQRLQVGPAVAPPPVGWKASIEPIFKASCANCHGASAVKVELQTAAGWKLWIDGIKVQVDNDWMPLVGPKLKPAQKALIKAWQAGGYAP